MFLLFGLIAGACTVFAGCGGDDKPSNASASNGPALSDTEYLQVFCTGLTNFQDALVSAPTADAIGNVVREYIDSLSNVNPPADLQDYQKQYIKYLQDALSEPTKLVTAPPPLPPDNVRTRLASKTKDVAACKYPTFLEVRPTPTP